MSIASKLKDLVIKWGGQPTKDDDSIEELIALLTELDAPGGGPLIVTVIYSGSERTLNKTWQEIYDAMPNVCIFGDLSDVLERNALFVKRAFARDNESAFVVQTDADTYEALSPEDYPVSGGK